MRPLADRSSPVEASTRVRRARRRKRARIANAVRGTGASRARPRRTPDDGAGTTGSPLVDHRHRPGTCPPGSSGPGRTGLTGRRRKPGRRWPHAAPGSPPRSLGASARSACALKRPPDGPRAAPHGLCPRGVLVRLPCVLLDAERALRPSRGHAGSCHRASSPRHHASAAGGAASPRDLSRNRPRLDRSLVGRQARRERRALRAAACPAAESARD